MEQETFTRDEVEALIAAIFRHVDDCVSRESYWPMVEYLTDDLGDSGGRFNKLSPAFREMLRAFARRELHGS
jgi:hypothetical protein